MAIEYSPATEVELVAQTVIEEYYPDLKGLDIAYVYRSKASVSKGRLVLGKARKITGLNAFLAGRMEDFFCVEIGLNIWTKLTPAQQHALVDHELMHFVIDEETEDLLLRGHDLEEFNEIVKRRGAWKGDIESFLRAAEGVQLELLGDMPENE